MVMIGEMQTKIQQVGDEKIAILKSDEHITFEQLGHLKKTLVQHLPGYKILVCEKVDMDFGKIAREKIDMLHTELHNYLELVDNK